MIPRKNDFCFTHLYSFTSYKDVSNKIQINDLQLLTHNFCLTQVYNERIVSNKPFTIRSLTFKEHYNL